ncbi:hypothetical protein [Bradyrhizobium sp. LHD-71]|uniref:hypothetical protein n=1 Tax=Bradyrhizobium sp. LHD-71 TaxID=3072141 RepID=UPI00280C5889|nr:hypothetical protein [Bradyrhizobium sp. LHD-71]MDQ8727385.1 hypothetical protein [Bradyrhizobium sp. LHD-71]
MAEEQDWGPLREQAERLLGSTEAAIATEARRMRALALAHSDQDTEKRLAVAEYRELSANGAAEPVDLAALASVLADLREYDEAKKMVLHGIQAAPNAADGFAQIGQRIVEATGDHSFRDELKQLRSGKGAK